MNDWTGGYVADINYTHGYYQELNPLRIAMAFANAGLQAPATGVACELGFGQGLSANIHAAASVTTWHGTDFNPAQAAFARELAHASGNGAQLVDQSFADFCRRDDLPDFDYICLHGIWCWISPANQQEIVAFIRRKLKVGGVLYISYNCQPGWAPMVPVRGLLTHYADTMTPPGAGRTQRIASALDFTDRLLETSPAYFAAYPRVADRLKSLRGQNRQYLVHEYFSRDWQPTSFAEMADILGEAKLTYACPAHFLDHITDLNLTRPQQELLAQLPDPVFAESVRDFMVNQNFRSDYWVKGARPLTLLQKAEAMRRPRVVLVTPRAQFDLKITGKAIEGQLSEAIYLPLLDLLADFEPRTIGELEAALDGKGLNLQQVFEAVLVLAGKGNLMLAQDESHIEAAIASSQQLNRALFEHARGSEDIAFIASPVVGAGVSAPRIAQLFLLAHVEGERGVAALTDYVWDTLSSQDQRMVKDGQRLDAPADSIAEIRRQAERFEHDYLAIYRALRVIG
jgi:SAM-dependent methyltransferase